MLPQKIKKDKKLRVLADDEEIGYSGKNGKKETIFYIPIWIFFYIWSIKYLAKIKLIKTIYLWHHYQRDINKGVWETSYWPDFMYANFMTERELFTHSENY